MSQRIVIVGASNTGCELAERLSSRHPVFLLDKREERLKQFGKVLEPADASEKLQQRGVIPIMGDGTSRLVLRQLLDPDFQCALVAAAGSDDYNHEIGRLGKELGFEPVVAIQHHPSEAERYRKENITALDRSALLADTIGRSLRNQGAVVPTCVGLGKGELVEIRLLRTSPVINRPLKKLAPHRWRVAAVFRDDALIVPTGDTLLQVDDRVLLVGDCKILPTVAEYLRLGTPQFPRPFGPNVVTLEFGGSDEKMKAEGHGLACNSNAAHLVRGTPEGETKEPEEVAELLTEPQCKGDFKLASFALPPIDDPAFGQQLSRQRPGVVLIQPVRRSLAARILGLQGADATVCDQVSSPVLFCRATHPYKRILLSVSNSDLNIRSAETAIDITRQLEASLTAINVDLPRYISGESEEVIHQEVVPIRRLCELYEVPLDYRHREGNPVKHLVEESKHHDLLVMARPWGRRDNFFDPDVALRLARAAHCSVLVLTIRPEA